MDEYAARFAGIARLYGEPALAQLRAMHFCVVGVGGVGSWACEALVRSGVGALTMIDLDEVCVSNTNRQLPATRRDIGRPKVTVLQERLLDINPECRLHAVMDFVTPHNVSELISPDCHGVLDAIDSVAPKAALIAHCRRRKQSIIVCGSAGAQIDPTQIRVGDLSRTQNDPLLAKTRSVLRQQYGISRNPKRHWSLNAVYSLEQMRYVQENGQVGTTKPETMTHTCDSGFGASMMMTASVGLVATARLIDKALRKQRA